MFCTMLLFFSFLFCLFKKGLGHAYGSFTLFSTPLHYSLVIHPLTLMRNDAQLFIKAYLGFYLIFGMGGGGYTMA